MKKATGERGVRDIAAVVNANMTIKGSVTSRIPHRSIIFPTNGVAAAPTMWEMMIADAMVPRFQPNSLVTGFSKTPNVNSRIGPLLTINPRVAPKTTHQGFLKTVRRGMMVLGSLH